MNDASSGLGKKKMGNIKKQPQAAIWMMIWIILLFTQANFIVCNINLRDSERFMGKIENYLLKTFLFSRNSKNLLYSFPGQNYYSFGKNKVKDVDKGFLLAINR